MNKKYFVIVLSFVFLQFAGFVHGAIPASERASLIALYNDTNGDHWNYNSGWKTPPLNTDGFAMPGTEGSWYGITVEADHVEKIAMNSGTLPVGNNLVGSIPSQLGNLSNLEYLNLSANHLSGSIPPQLGNLSNLQILYLYQNQLSGNIPPQLGNLSNLLDLYLQENQLTGSIPAQLFDLGELRFLFLGNNQLSGSLPPVGSSLNMISLVLSHNQLSGEIPFGFGGYRLKYLFLDHNTLRGEIPSNFMKVHSPEFLLIGIDYNCLYATDPELIGWLDGFNPGWDDHQNQCGNNLPEINPPFGSFDTPIDGSIVAGSIAVTGWALDESGIDRVQIYQNQDNSQIYIGDAIFVEGARPDVAALYPEYFENTRAGWGYMMLTNLLPGNGNGTYTISAIATDLKGKTTALGTKTITVDNTHAVKPFGAIDTPTQGGEVSGDRFTQFGWALTPQPNSISTNGSSIHVWVDGVNKGHPVYNNYRSDIATLFPGYANSNGAIGYFYLDTTKYANGLHTIQWTVTDNASNTDGIGSRYFTILNEGANNVQFTCQKEIGLDSLPEENGNSGLVIKEMEHVEIALGQTYADIQGYLINGRQLNKLPIGSTLDKKRGLFFWSPGPGFLGRYVLVFVLTDVNGLSQKKSIEINIEPKYNK